MFRRQFSASGNITNLRLRFKRYPLKWLSYEGVQRRCEGGVGDNTTLSGPYRHHRFAHP